MFDPAVGGLCESERTVRPPAETSTSSEPTLPSSVLWYDSSTPVLPMCVLPA